MFEPNFIKNILFLDIETVRGKKDFEELSETMQKMWFHKAKSIKTEEELSEKEKYLERAAIYSEFGQVVTISFGMIRWENGEAHLRVKSFFGEDESEVLKDFKKLLDEDLKAFPKLQLCAHNGKEFDFPYLSRRFLINQIPLPKILQTQGKKPWEVQHLDTMELWKFGDWKNFTKLELLCEVFGIPTPKGDIDGSQVGEVFWEEKDVERITRYCEKDVLAIAQLYLKYAILPIIKEENITFATFENT